MESHTTYEGHGIRTAYREDGYSTLTQDLDDSTVVEARTAALAEIDAALSTASPGAERVAGLTAARRDIAALRSRAEVEAERIASAREAIREARETLADPNSYLNYQISGMCGLSESGPESLREEAQRLAEEMKIEQSRREMVDRDNQAAAAAERQRKEEANRAEIAARRERILALLRGLDRPDVAERYEAGVLPDEDLDEALTVHAHRSIIADQYRPLVAADVCTCGEVTYGSEVAERVDSHTWCEARKLRDLLPAGAESQIRRHWGTCSCDNPSAVSRFSLQVRIELAGIGKFVREYALD